MTQPINPIYVLTADRTLMGDYRVLFDGMVSSSQTTATPAVAMRWFISRRMPAINGRASRAPMGLRRIEAALLAAGVRSEDVCIVAPEDLHKVIGPRTRVVGVSSGDPLGRGMNDGTMRGLAGGRMHIEVWFARMMQRLKRIREKRDFRVLFGGPGAWQLVADPARAAEMGIDTIFSGYGERDAADVFRRLADGDAVEPIIEGATPAAEEIPPIVGPTNMGVVEVSRGCGWGCSFCTMAREPMIHLPVDTILSDVKTNVRGGVDSVSLVSEDLFRYGSTGSRPNADALLAMLDAVRRTPGLRLMQTDHANVASTMGLTDAELKAVHDTMVRGVRHEHLWVNIGVESAAGELVEANQGLAKIAPFSVEDWGRVCHEAMVRLIEAGFLPMVSLIFGLPGETQEHVRRTLRWVNRFADKRLMIFPLFYEPLAAGERPFGIHDMTRLHWRLLRTCYALNFRWGPRMYQDNLRGAGASWSRRAMLRAASVVEVLQMKARFAIRGRSFAR